ncbi:MAG: sulfite exporter TauE/SafE family protein, partial [Burkholderiales bacterium]
LAGVVKGVIGMGLPIVAMGLLVLFLPPAQAAAVLVVPSLVTNIWQLAAGPKFGALAKRFATMMAGIAAGTFLGIGILTGDAVALANATLGAVLGIYGAMGLLTLHFNVRPQSERWLSPAIGVVTGVLTGATGIFAVPAVPYFSSLRLEREELIQTLGLSFTVSTIALAIALGTRGVFEAQLGIASLLALIPTTVGMLLGQRLRKRLHPEVFRRWFLVALVVLGIYMVVRATA